MSLGELFFWYTVVTFLGLSGIVFLTVAKQQIAPIRRALLLVAIAVYRRRKERTRAKGTSVAGESYTVQ